MRTDGLPVVVACPTDRGALEAVGSSYRCTVCGQEFARGSHGYLELFESEDPAARLDTAAAHPASGLERGEVRLYESYLREWLGGFGAERVLDAGCGTGLVVRAMLDDGIDGYGIDLPGSANGWGAEEFDHDRYFCGNVTRLPFRDGTFDAVLTVGVIEHVGTKTGQITLRADYATQRAQFASELLRVTRPNGRILLSGPNKRFPIDIQHGPTDAHTRAPLRSWMFQRTGLNVHRTFGRYHLASYADVDRWFRGHRWRALSLEGYFGFSSFQDSGSRMARAARRYANDLPAAFRRTALNPYVLVEVTA